MNFKRKTIIFFLCIYCVNAQAEFSTLVKDYGLAAARFAVANVAANYIAAGAQMVWSRFLIMRGFDQDSVMADSRAVGTASQKRFPSKVMHQVRIAPETVPLLLRDRIARLNFKDYSWPTCKPILLTGLAGSGKTQLGYYVAQSTDSPFLYESASGLMGSRTNSGVEQIFALFKRARRRPFIEGSILTLKNIVNRIMRRPQVARKPAVILLDEIDALAAPVDESAVIAGDQNLEHERHNAFERLLWEIARNPHKVGKPVGAPLTNNPLLRALWRDLPDIAAKIPHVACPPADFWEKNLVSWARGVIVTEIGAIKRTLPLDPEEVRNIDAIVAAVPDELIIPLWNLICNFKLDPNSPLYKQMFEQNQDQELQNFLSELKKNNPNSPLYRQLQGQNRGQRWYQRFSQWLFPSLFGRSVNFVTLILRVCEWSMAKDDTDALVIATTNKPADELDPRVYDVFDVINMRPLTAQDRLHVLKFHGRDKQFADDVQLEAIANATENFTGDELAAIVNDAAIVAATADRTKITGQDIDQAFACLNDMKRLRQNA